MAVIASTSVSGTGSRVVAGTVLGASDTFTYTSGAILVLRNATGGALTPNLLGNQATDVTVPGLGSVSVAAGYTTPSIGAGAMVAVPLDSIAKFLTGTSVVVTGGSGIEASLLVA